MSTKKPIFVATHPRACSTAFERVFMQCRDTLHCVHEPFGDAFYFGPERLSNRFEDDEKARMDSGFGDITYGATLENMHRENTEGKRLFIKDMAQYWMPMDSKPATLAPSLVSYRRGIGTSDGTATTNGTASKSPPYPYATPAEPDNPCIVPDALLRQFHFTFLIRHPRYSIPSYYRCTIPPLQDMTRFDYFDPREAGYRELRALFEYLVASGHVGPRVAGQPQVNGEAGTKSVPEICVVDADDLLDAPYAMIEAYCRSAGIEYSPSILKWDDDESQKLAEEAFEKWRGFHEDALHSTELRPRAQKKVHKPDEELYAEWVQKYGEDAAKSIKKAVDDNIDDYNFLLQFAIKL